MYETFAFKIISKMNLTIFYSYRAVTSNKYESVKTLLDLGGSPNYRDGKGLTPLYLSVLGHSEPNITQVLVIRIEYYSVSHFVSQSVSSYSCSLYCRNKSAQGNKGIRQWTIIDKLPQ